MSLYKKIKKWLNNEQEKHKVQVTKAWRKNRTYAAIIYLFFAIGLPMATNVWAIVLDIIFIWTDILNLKAPRFWTFHPIIQGIYITLVLVELGLFFFSWFFPGVYLFMSAERTIDRNWPHDGERTKKWREKYGNP